jgi:hypothetical protein
MGDNESRAIVAFMTGNFNVFGVWSSGGHCVRCHCSLKRISRALGLLGGVTVTIHLSFPR